MPFKLCIIENGSGNSRTRMNGIKREWTQRQGLDKMFEPKKKYICFKNETKVSVQTIRGCQNLSSSRLKIDQDQIKLESTPP